MMQLAVAVVLLFLVGCAAIPAYSTSPYQVKANAMVDAYNAQHGTQVPRPIVRVGTEPNLREGDCFFVPGVNSWITIAEAWDNQRHGPGYAIANTLPHEVAHHICYWLGLAPAGQYHGDAWKRVALELGLPADDAFITDPSLADSNA